MIERLSRRGVITTCVAVVVGTAGCSTRSVVVVSLKDVREQQNGSNTTINATLAVLNGYQGQFIIEDVRIVFEAANRSVLHTESVGRINGTDFTYNLSVQFEQPPQTIRIRPGPTKTKADVDIQNLRRNETGGWEWYTPEREN